MEPPNALGLTSRAASAQGKQGSGPTAIHYARGSCKSPSISLMAQARIKGWQVPCCRANEEGEPPCKKAPKGPLQTRSTSSREGRRGAAQKTAISAGATGQRRPAG